MPMKTREGEWMPRMPRALSITPLTAPVMASLTALTLDKIPFLSPSKIMAPKPVNFAGRSMPNQLNTLAKAE